MIEITVNGKEYDVEYNVCGVDEVWTGRSSIELIPEIEITDVWDGNGNEIKFAELPEAERDLIYSACQDHETDDRDDGC